jgi:hypothetical protein
VWTYEEQVFSLSPSSLYRIVNDKRGESESERKIKYVNKRMSLIIALIINGL